MSSSENIKNLPALRPLTLSPAQQRALGALKYALDVNFAVTLSGGSCTGKSAVLEHLHRDIGGLMLRAADFLKAAAATDPLAIDDAMMALISSSLRSHPLVIIDDLSTVLDIFSSCGDWPRKGLTDLALIALAAEAEQSGSRLVIGSLGWRGGALSSRTLDFSIHAFEVEDYQAIATHWLPEGAAEKLDFAKIHRFAPKLNARQLRDACVWLASGEDNEISTERVVDYLHQQRLSSNVELSEVQAVDLRLLQGVDDVIRSLEDHIVLPFENDELSQELALKPKRGVLLHGPPGTGKTTVGRALAHRLRGKFFLVDGTFISGTSQFYESIHRIFNAAKQNAPAVIFIDDADAIFENNEDRGLYRYLLTMLDGLEDGSTGRVCVMLTAMNVAHLPPALVRSGRVELWLEMKLPDEQARTAILRRMLEALPAAFHGVDAAALAAETEGFTGADLKHLVEDGKVIFAGAKVRGETEKSPAACFLEAAAGVRHNKQLYARAEQEALQHARQRQQLSNSDCD